MHRLLLVALALSCVPLALHAQETVFYKCTDAKGQVSMQNGTPCAPGMKQEVRRIGAVKTVPVPQKKPAAQPSAQPPVYGDFVLAGGPNGKRAPAPEAAGLPAPPALFQCRTWEGKDYLGETATPEPRCVPLQVVGMDGGDASSMGSACEMKHDTCIQVPAEQLCGSWYRRLDEAEFKLRYAGDDNRGERQSAFDAIAAKINASQCSTEAPPAAAAANSTP